MFIVFGTRGMTTRAGSDEILQQACPECKSDLALKNLKRWFTLFFIPIFPFDTVQTFYQCEKCKSSYKQSAKNALLESSKDRDQVMAEVKVTFVRGVVACMTHMAAIDGEIDESEMNEIKNTASKFPDYQNEIDEVIKKVTSSIDAEDYVFSILKKCAEVLSAEAILSLLANAAKVLLADGKIDKAEETLLKEYLLVCGLPKSLYNTIVEKMKGNA